MTQSNYTLKCIERAVDFMSSEAQKGQTPTLERVAQAAGLSKFHFNRIYRLATGETPQETLTRFKLSLATEQLRDPKASVTDVAFSAGYGSSQSFAKALKRVLSQSASAIRQDQERLTSAIAELSVPKSDDGKARAELRVEIAQMTPFKAIMLHTDGSYPNLNENYWALFEAAGDPSVVSAILGQPYGDIGGDPVDTLRFDCGLKLQEIPDELPEAIEVRELEGGVHLLTRHIGSYDRLPEAIDRLYLAALAHDEIEIPDEPLLFHYLDDPETTEEAQLRTDLYLPIKY
ncbi:MAG: GyrI-like domain-containing protein [Pseudomonadota bacterium]